MKYTYSQLMKAGWREKLDSLIDAWDRAEELKWQVNNMLPPAQAKVIADKIDESRRTYFDMFRRLPILEISPADMPASATWPREAAERLEEFRQMRDAIRRSGPMGPTPLADQTALWEQERDWNDYGVGIEIEAINEPKQNAPAADSPPSVDEFLEEAALVPLPSVNELLETIALFTPAPAVGARAERATPTGADFDSLAIDSPIACPVEAHDALPNSKAPLASTAGAYVPPAFHRADRFAPRALPQSPALSAQLAACDRREDDLDIEGDDYFWSTSLVVGVGEIVPLGSGCGGSGGADDSSLFHDIYINGWSRERNETWRDEQIAIDRVEHVQGDRVEFVGGNRQEEIEGSLTLKVEGILTETVGLSDSAKTLTTNLDEPKTVSLSSSDLVSALKAADYDTGSDNSKACSFAAVTAANDGTIPDAVEKITVAGENIRVIGGKVSESFDKNVAGKITGDYTKSVQKRAVSTSGSSSALAVFQTTLSGSQSSAVDASTGNLTVTIKGNETKNITGDYVVNVDGDFTEVVQTKQSINAAGKGGSSSDSTISQIFGDAYQSYYWGNLEQATMAAAESISVAGAFEMVEAAGEFKIKAPLQSLNVLAGVAFRFLCNWSIDLNLLFTRSKAADFRTTLTSMKTGLSKNKANALQVDVGAVDGGNGIEVNI